MEAYKDGFAPTVSVAMTATHYSRRRFLTMRSFCVLILSSVAAASFDYIVVGGGTAGLVIANRLTENPAIRVAVIEPGDDQRQNPNVTDPTKLDQPLNTPLDWQYKSVPQVYAQDRILNLPQGKAWGGSSAINGGPFSQLSPVLGRKLTI